MRIDHIAMYVHDLEAAKLFFMQYFQGVPNEKYHNPKTDFESYFLSFADGSRLEIMTKPGLMDSGNLQTHYGYAHLAFSVGSHQKVDMLTAQLEQDGYAVLSGPRTTGDGYYESCILGIEGNIIEITV